jgi:hypothetical protein
MPSKGNQAVIAVGNTGFPVQHSLPMFGNLVSCEVGVASQVEFTAIEFFDL